MFKEYYLVKKIDKKLRDNNFTIFKKIRIFEKISSQPNKHCNLINNLLKPD